MIMRSRLLELLEEAYPDPSQWATVEGFQRAHHDDVTHLDDEELDDERVLARIRRAATPRHQRTQWLVERVTVLEREAARRHQQKIQQRRSRQ
jgi:hypothetical protein